MAGFDAGADDYITKPIKPKVLVSKVKALLRRLKDDEKVDEILKIGNLTINREEYKIIIKGQELLLPRKEFELLSLLATKPNKVFKREEILDRVWGNEVIVVVGASGLNFWSLWIHFGNPSAGYWDIVS